MNIQAMMQQAQAMQRDLKSKKDKINAMDFEGESSIVKVTVNGKKEVTSVKILNKDSFDSEDLEVLEDMILVAINDAFKKVDETTKKELGQLASMGDLI